MINCSNCGAKFDENMPECPYCGQIYVPGAEKEYMDNLHEIKEDMSRVPEMSRQIYHKEMKGTVKKTGVIFGILAVIFLLGAGILFGLGHLFDYSESEEEIKARMAWERENFPILDQWYEEGNYQAILDFSQETYEDTGYNLYEWDHYSFISYFEGHQICMDIRDMVRNKEEIQDYLATEVMYWGMDIMYSREKDSLYINEIYTPEELEQMEQWKQDVEAFFHEELQYTPEELSKMAEDVYQKGYLSFDRCIDYESDILTRIRNYNR